MSNKETQTEPRILSRFSSDPREMKTACDEMGELDHNDFSAIANLVDEVFPVGETRFWLAEWRGREYVFCEWRKNDEERFETTILMPFFGKWHVRYLVEHVYTHIGMLACSGTHGLHIMAQHLPSKSFEWFMEQHGLEYAQLDGSWVLREVTK